ncbi:unnamed protein product [Miscanthus lutarioriparius]|uniref:Potassium transporter n=1 Tax=Miscanthus lutarioriparius TaxID=422564 RepID=A0A811Q490_9POAL|nr:unnamed protein product [Miscanthus lutarioriparius]
MSSSAEAESAAAATERFQRHDSLYGDAEKVTNGKHHGSGDSWVQTLMLAFQSIGVVYGDIGTSPLYVYSSTFSDGIRHPDDLLGVLYTLILIPMLKYVFVVLHANDNGDGGTFALYSLISRYAKIRMIPDQQSEDATVSNYRVEVASSRLLRTLMPAISDGSLTSQGAPVVVFATAEVVWISVAILFLLFSVQRFGTDKVGYSFALIISVWFVLIAGTGMYNLAVHDATVLGAFNPMYIVDYFRRNGKEAWVSLGGVVLCITGTEAKFADLGHFNIRAIQISFTCILFPSVALCYMGQAAYLRKFPENVVDTFYKSIPAPMFWPVFLVAILAAIIASQAMLSGAFAILSKALSLGCFPRVEVVHTSSKYAGQVYLPEVNFLIGAASVAVTLGFQTTANIGNAYGICVVTVFSITTHLLAVVMLLVWRAHPALSAVFGLVEFLYLSSILSKFAEGGYLPFCFSLVLMALMAAWHYVHVLRYWYELDRAVPAAELAAVLARRDVRRVPGVGLLYSELVQGIPPVFPRLVDKIPSVHAVFVFVSIKHLPIPRVAAPERFIFRRVGPVDHRVFRCVARYGYTNPMEGHREFVAFLLDRLKTFVQEEAAFAASSGSSAAVAEEEQRFIDAEAERGVVYLMGEATVTAAAGSSLLKRVVVNSVYGFLRKNLRERHKALSILKDQLLRVGITYEI